MVDTDFIHFREDSRMIVHWLSFNEHKMCLAGRPAVDSCGIFIVLFLFNDGLLAVEDGGIWQWRTAEYWKCEGGLL